MKYVPLGLAALGMLLILVGVVVSIVDWNRAHAVKERRVVTEETSLDKSITALAKLAEALGKMSVGMQLIFAGMALEIIAAFFGGIALIGQ